MAITEKKALLRGMYQPPNAAEPSAADARAGNAAAGKAEFPFDRLFHFGAHAALYFLVLIGVGILYLTAHRHFNDGLAFETGIRTRRYISDTFQMAGLCLFLILLGIGLFILFREHLPRRLRWIAFSLLLALFPGAIGTGIALHGAFQAGRSAAFERLDFKKLTDDGLTIHTALGDDIHHVRLNESDPDFPLLPVYVREHLRATAIDVHPEVVVIHNTEDSSYDHGEGVVIPKNRMSTVDVQEFAEKYHLKVLNRDPTVFQFDESSDLNFGGAEPLAAPDESGTAPAPSPPAPPP